MYRIRFHGRGGQGVKTASRMLGTAFFLEGFEVQDAPRYGAERRGAPIFAYVRADQRRIHERGVIEQPDLVVVADDSLLLLSAVGVATGLSERSAALVETPWPAARVAAQLGLPVGRVVCVPPPEDAARQRLVGTRLAAGAARLVGVIDGSTLERAVEQELDEVGADPIRASVAEARAAFGRLAEHGGLVAPQPNAAAPRDLAHTWVELEREGVERSAPAVLATRTSLAQKTGLWRTQRPEIERATCHRCTWVCGTLCPDGAIVVGPEGYPRVDLDHCKGCMVCEAVCPFHAIAAVPEREREVTS